MKKHTELEVSDTNVILPIEKYNELLKCKKAMEKPMKNRFFLGFARNVPVFYETEDDAVATVGEILKGVRKDKNELEARIKFLESHKKKEIEALKKLNIFQFYFWKHGKFKGDFSRAFALDALKAILIGIGAATIIWAVIERLYPFFQ